MGFRNSAIQKSARDVKEISFFLAVRIGSAAGIYKSCQGFAQ